MKRDFRSRTGHHSPQRPYVMTRDTEDTMLMKRGNPKHNCKPDHPRVSPI